MKQILAALPVVVRDVAGVVGAGLLSYGAGSIYRPLGFIVAGGILLAICLLLARAE